METFSGGDILPRSRENTFCFCFPPPPPKKVLIASGIFHPSPSEAHLPLCVFPGSFTHQVITIMHTRRIITVILTSKVAPRHFKTEPVSARMKEGTAVRKRTVFLECLAVCNAELNYKNAADRSEEELRRGSSLRPLRPFCLTQKYKIGRAHV